MSPQIFCTDSAKAIKANEYGYINAIQYLAPAHLSGVNLCPHASPGCMALCLGWHSGHAGLLARGADTNPVRQARLAKSQRFMNDRAAYMRDVVRSIELLDIKAQRANKALCVRLNGSSDIAWEGIRCTRAGREYRNVFDAFPHIAFVDYTKNPNRFTRALPSNYHLTFSRSESNERVATQLLARGVNVAVVFAGTKPKWWHWFRVIDGDKHDLRQLDPRGRRGIVVALSPKGHKAKRDTTGFVVRLT